MSEEKDWFMQVLDAVKKEVKTNDWKSDGIYLGTDEIVLRFLRSCKP